MKYNDIILSAILQLVKEEKFPNVEFKKGIQLYDEIMLMSDAGALVAAGESSKKNVERWFADILTDYNVTDGLVEAIADKFVEMLSAANTTLTEVTTIVDGLMKEITEDIQNRASMDERISANFIESSKDYSFETFNFGMLRSMGNAMDIAEHVESAVLINKDIIAAQKFRICTNKYIAMNRSKLTLAEVDFDSEFKEAAITKVASSDENLTKDQVRETYNLLVAPNRMNGIVDKAERLLKEYNKDATTSVFFFTTLIATHAKALDKVETTLLEGTTDTVVIANIADATKLLTVLMEIGAYFVQYMRDNMFAETVVFANGVRNPDMVTKVEEANVTDKDIAMHIKHILNEMPIPRTGLMLSRIVQYQEEVTKTVAKSEYAENVYVGVTKKKIKRTAIVNSVAEYLKSMSGDKCTDFVMGYADRIITTAVPIADVVYECIITKLHKDTLVEAMYKELGKGYVNLLADNKEVTQDMVTEANAIIFTDMISGFMKKQFLI